MKNWLVVRAAGRLHLIHVLMTVDEVLRPSPGNVVEESVKALMHVVVAFMNPTRRVVADEHVNGRHLLNQGANFMLLPEVVSPRLVAPTAVEAAETNYLELNDLQMQIDDTVWERSR